MIKELIVKKSGREGTLFESGEKIPYSEMKGLYKKGDKVLVFVPDEESETDQDSESNKGYESDEGLGKCAEAGCSHKERKQEYEQERKQDKESRQDKECKQDKEYAPRISAKIYNYLLPTDRFKVGETVEGLVYELKPEMGAFVAVEDRYHGLIPLNEMYREIKVGSRLELRITKITDGKLRLSVRKRAKDQLDEDVETVLEALRKGGGILYMNDDTPPEVIKRKLNLSKKAFKRAVGRLLSTGKIEIEEDAISLTQS